MTLSFFGSLTFKYWGCRCTPCPPKLLLLFPKVNAFLSSYSRNVCSLSLSFQFEHVLSGINNQLSHTCLGLDLPLLKPMGSSIFLNKLYIFIYFQTSSSKFPLKPFLVYICPARADMLLTISESPRSMGVSVLILRYLPHAMFSSISLPLR